MNDAAPLRLAFLGDPNSVHTRRWLGWFAARGHEVTLLDPFAATITPGLPDHVRVHRYDVGTTGVPLFGLWRRRSALRRALRDVGADILHAHFVRRYGWQAGLAAHHPFVVSPWGSDILRVPRGAIRTRLWNQLALRTADLVTVSSEGMRIASVAAGARPARVRLINHGVDTSYFAPGPPDQELARRLGLGDGPVILAPRTLRSLYRQDVIVEAVALLAPALRPWLVMSARGADDAYRAMIEARAARLGIADRLLILDDIGHHELPAVLRLARVVVSVPETDSFPLTVLEAMSTGVPVVASDLPAVTPVMRGIDPLAGNLIAPVGDVAATAAAIERALRLSDPDRERLTAVLRAHVVQTADHDTNMAAMESLYRSLVAGHR